MEAKFEPYRSSSIIDTSDLCNVQMLLWRLTSLSVDLLENAGLSSPILDNPKTNLTKMGSDGTNFAECFQVLIL